MKRAPSARAGEIEKRFKIYFARSSDHTMIVECAEEPSTVAAASLLLATGWRSYNLVGSVNNLMSYSCLIFRSTIVNFALLCSVI